MPVHLHASVILARRHIQTYRVGLLLLLLRLRLPSSVPLQRRQHSVGPDPAHHEHLIDAVAQHLRVRRR